MLYEHLMRLSHERAEELRHERWALTQAHRVSGRSPLARAVAAGLRRLAASLDGEPAPRLAPVR